MRDGTERENPGCRIVDGAVNRELLNVGPSTFSYTTAEDVR